MIGADCKVSAATANQNGKQKNMEDERRHETNEVFN